MIEVDNIGQCILQLVSACHSGDCMMNTPWSQVFLRVSTSTFRQKARPATESSQVQSAKVIEVVGSRCCTAQGGSDKSRSHHSSTTGKVRSTKLVINFQPRILNPEELQYEVIGLRKLQDLYACVRAYKHMKNLITCYTIKNIISVSKYAFVNK